MTAWMTADTLAALPASDLLARLTQALSRRSRTLVRDGAAILDTATDPDLCGPYPVTTTDLLVEVEAVQAALAGTSAAPVLGTAKALAMDGWLDGLAHSRREYVA